VAVESSRESPRRRWVERQSARGKKKGRAKANHDSHSRDTTWPSYFLGLPFVHPPLILHRSEGVGAISFGGGKGADGIVVGVEVGLDCRGWPLTIVIIGL